MALYRCAACGSPNVVTDTQKEGYDYVKGAIGTVVLGAGGAAAGINGKKKQVYKCPDCGLTLNEPMPMEIKTAIDIGVSLPSKRKDLKVAGVVVGWDVLVRKYKNIEKDIVASDSTVSAQQNFPTTNTPTATRKLSELSRAELTDLSRKLDEADRKHQTIMLAYKGEKEYVDEQRSKMVESGIAKFRISLEHSTKETLKKTMETLSLSKDEYSRRKAEAEQKLSSLGFLQFSEKNRIKNEISSLTVKLDEVEKAITSAQKQYDTEMNAVTQKVNARKEQLKQEARLEYRYPKCPDSPSYASILAQNDVHYNSGAANHEVRTAIANVLDKIEIIEYLKEHPSSTISDIKQGCRSLKDYTNLRVSGLVRQLHDSDKVVRTEDAQNAYFSIK